MAHGLPFHVAVLDHFPAAKAEPEEFCLHQTYLKLCPEAFAATSWSNEEIGMRSSAYSKVTESTPAANWGWMPVLIARPPTLFSRPLYRTSPGPVFSVPIEK